MTPPAATAAGARTTPAGARTARKQNKSAARAATNGARAGKSAERAGTGAGRASSHARTVRRPTAPRARRRVSGPLRSKAATLPRRVTLPARAERRRRIAPLQERAVAWIRALPDHALLDRIVRGRTWIVLLGVLLAGIVAMQVEMLKLNATIGRSIELGTALQSRNELLRTSVSELSDEQRLERLATKMGMVMPGPTSVGFLEANKVNASQAAANIHAPDPSSFESLLQATGSGQITPLGADANGTLTVNPTVTTLGAAGTSSTSTGSSTTAAATSSTGTTSAGTGAVSSTGATTGTTAGTTTATGTGAGTTAAGTTATGTGTAVTPAGGTAAGTTGAAATTTGTAAATTGGTTLQSPGG